MSEMLRSGIVRIFREADQQVVGAGFLVDANKKTILTCAHVINAALDTPGNVVRPRGLINLDFPFLSAGQNLDARVIAFFPKKADDSDDWAVLEILDDLPERAEAVRLVVSESFNGHEFGVYGFPEPYEKTGQYVEGKLQERLANERIQAIGTTNLGFFVEWGFSGGPIFNKNINAVVGMMMQVEDKRDRRIAFISPVDVIATLYPYVSFERVESSPVNAGSATLVPKPLPDAGTTLHASPVTLPAYPLKRDAFPFPIELSKLWGLNRGQFCGLLLTNQPAEVRQALAVMERSLYDAWDRHMPPEAVKTTRWWLTVQPEKQPNGILQPDDLAACIVEEAFAQYIRQHGLDPDILLGLIMRLSADDFNVSVIRPWLSSLFRATFGQYQTALIILIEDTPTNEALKRISRDLQDLAGIAPSDFPVQAFFTMPTLPADVNKLQTRPTQVQLANLLRKHRWMELSTDSLALSDCLPDRLDMLTTRYGTQTNLHAVVRFLEEQADAKCVDDLITLVQQHDMGKMPDLMFYLAQSQYAIQALKSVFLWQFTHHRADAWLDAWIEGREAGAPGKIDETQLDTALCDWIALGLIRLRARARVLLAQQLRALKPLLSREMQKIYTYLFEAGSPVDYFDDISTTALHMIAGCGCTNVIPLDILQSAPLVDTDLWYAFFALPPSTEENEGLFGALNATSRVVIGLCSPTEWEQHQDNLLQEQITTCRRGNKLFFASARLG